MEEWRSPRGIEEDILKYKRKRFDFHMELEDIGFHATRELALAAFRAELTEEECQTAPINTIELRRLLDEKYPDGDEQEQQ